MATIHASSAVKALRRFGELAMRSHQQANRDDIAADIADSVQYVVQVQRYANGRKVGEVVEVLCYDRTAKVFEFNTKFNRADTADPIQLARPAEWAQFDGPPVPLHPFITKGETEWHYLKSKPSTKLPPPSRSTSRLLTGQPGRTLIDAPSD
jgi:pilus assembly protein CpaF